jgi:hypothetical protein
MVDSFAFNFRDEMKFLATSGSLTKIAESYLTFNLLTRRVFFSKASTLGHLIIRRRERYAHRVRLT